MNLNVTEHGTNPFDYWVVDNFLDYSVAKDLSAEFPDYERKIGLLMMVGLHKKRFVISGTSSHHLLTRLSSIFCPLTSLQDCLI